MRFFIWMVLKDRLFTNVEHVRRGLVDNSACGICSHNFEYALHAIRDCNAAKVILAQVDPVNKQGQFFSGTLKEWFLVNLHNHLRISMGEVDWPFFLA